MTTIQLPKDYGYVVLTAGAMSFHAIFQGFFVGMARNKYFGPEFLKSAKVKALSDEHKKEFGSEVNKNAYPDMGCGRYADLLSYGDWVRFNNAQRVHLNYLEHLTPVLAFLLLGGLQYPRFATGAGCVYILGREIYGRSYRKYGADKRFTGAIIFDLGLLALFGACMCAGAAMTGCKWLIKK
eukprot:GDKI01015206.1.p2 GENE.GDKI01015206.1~~GDKI01015206.1.p2  ORF type:complete len:182 (+),score=60.16 GDKI01015206.1:134-679(+)